MRLISLGNHYGAAEPFSHLFEETIVMGKRYEAFDNLNLTNKDVVLFCGGEDISPSLYKQKNSRHTSASKDLSERDRFEAYAMNLAVTKGSKLLGICRGAQLMCAIAGGSLYQHVNNHSGRGHMMKTKDNLEIHVCSVHHQMMNPFKTNHELIAWASSVLSDVHLIEGEKNIPVEVEPEVIYFKDVRGLAIQYHPEFMSDKSEAVVYSTELVKKYLLT